MAGSEANNQRGRKDRVYFSVPFAEKDEARKLGAQWDTARGAWYAPADVDLANFARWRFGERKFTPISPGSVFARPERNHASPDGHNDAQWMHSLSAPTRWK
jgi:hypothetical protein